ncbi:YgjP-like metallopeptidase domain-containing protein [Caproiciproducens faecalis]|uniref:M48 family metallopeptidase n=1 Tax=Caproiciproducens faecalis TaxID=2820301 RepID=A0ABS7DJG8_9FIRM|nr:YgjP-like metallopeptidase domain-containing protein [Caproiciproducens faecalis]MBW7571251.1 M48 family metallopeptidase [Caproiciproducens faecalis]
MQIVISGIPINVQKKNIKNMHLYVKPPDGHVIISAPLTMDDKAIEVYARTNVSWIKKQIRKFQEQPRSGKRQYVSGETIYIWGKQYFIKFVPDSKKNSFALQGDHVILSMSNESTVKQRENYIHEQYRILLKQEIERLLPKWEQITDLHCESWQTKYMVTRWGTCNTEKKKLWFNLQLAQKPIECLEFVILHELIHLRSRKHDATFIEYMDLYMPNWRDIRNELNERKLDYYDAHDESPLKKLINTERYDEIKDAALAYLETDPELDKKKYNVALSDIEIENVVHIEQPYEGTIAFDVIVSCDVESIDRNGKGQPYFSEKWLSIHCEVSIGIELSNFSIVNVGKCEVQEENGNDRFSGELVPIITRDDFDQEATLFLEKFYPDALEKPVPVPIRQIAENMNLTIIEDTRLSEELSIFGMVVFEDGNIGGANKDVLVRKAKRGTMYIDPRVYYEKTYGTANSTIAHECYHWYRHRPYHALMKMIGAKDDVGKVIQCAIQANNKDTEKWKAIDWMEWQANSVVLNILMPYQTCRIVIDKLLKEYVESVEEAYKQQGLETVIDRVGEYYGVSRQAVKTRMRQLGYSIIDGVYTYVNGHYIPHFSFNAEAVGRNQTFTISATDLFKAYCCSKEFRKIIDSGNVVYVDGHLCVNKPEYVEIGDDGTCHMTKYGLAHVDECCYLFDLGYTYESKYQGLKTYAQFLTKTNPQLSARECSYDPTNVHNQALNALMDNAPQRSNALRRYPGSFAETLVQLMNERHLSNKKLADLSLVGEKTIQRIRNDEEYPTSKQTVLGLCVGLKLSPAEAEDFFAKSDFKLNTTKTEDYIYKCILGSCAVNSIYAINEMLEAHGVPQLGSSSQE